MMFTKFKNRNDGNVAMIFAVTVTMLAIGLGVAVDYSSMERARTNLQNQVDSAALGAAIKYSEAKDKEDFDLDEAVKEFLVANGYDLSQGLPDAKLQNGIITVKAKTPHKLAFGGIRGEKKKNIGVESSVGTRGGQAVEVALVVDNTLSMNYEGRIGALKIGANEFVQAIEDSDTDSKIAIVPFARYVNVGIDKRGESWLDVPIEYDTDRTWQQATHSGGTCHFETRTIDRDGHPFTYEAEVCEGQTTTYEPYHGVIESRWEGCVGTRIAPDNSTDGNYVRRIKGLLTTQPYEVTGLSADVSAYCPAPITPLTNDYDKLKGDISNLFGTDNTFMPMGLMWGKRVLSSEAPFTEAETQEPVKQVMVVMSDGMNYAKIDNSAQSQSEMTAPPYIADLDADEVATGANTLSASLCEEIKSDGIEIYTIAFMITDTTSKNLLKNCASSAAHSFDAGSNTGLVDSFRNISKRLEAELRIIR